MAKTSSKNAGSNAAPKAAPKAASKATAAPEQPGGRRFPLRRLIPNAVTLLALCLGLTAFRQGLAGRFELAVICIVLAGFLDAFDGRLARLLSQLSGTAR